MDKKKILQHLDHTLLKQDATWEQIKTLCDEGMQYHVASVCIPPCYVKEARDYVEDRLKICTVIGFPNGYQTTAAKVAETKEAVEDGADEIDMVININRVKDDRFEEVLQEVKEIRAACEGKVLKVIIETCLLTKGKSSKCVRSLQRQGRIILRLQPDFRPEGLRLKMWHCCKNM